MEEAQLDRVGCFKYENVDGAAATEFDDHVPEDVKQDRWERFMAAQAKISEARLARKVGKTIEVIIDEVDEEGAIARSQGDAPEIDGNVFLNGATDLEVGDMVMVKIVESDEYDLWGVLDE